MIYCEEFMDRSENPHLLAQETCGALPELAGCVGGTQWADRNIQCGHATPHSSGHICHPPVEVRPPAAKAIQHEVNPHNEMVKLSIRTFFLSRMEPRPSTAILVPVSS